MTLRRLDPRLAVALWIALIYASIPFVRRLREAFAAGRRPGGVEGAWSVDQLQQHRDAGFTHVGSTRLSLMTWRLKADSTWRTPGNLRMPCMQSSEK